MIGTKGFFKIQRIDLKLDLRLDQKFHQKWKKKKKKKLEPGLKVPFEFKNRGNTSF
jgi:hypothetical protein